MISYPTSLLAVGGARTGIAPVNLLDVEDVNGNLYYWADRPIQAPAFMSAPSAPVTAGVTAPVSVPAGQAVAWAYPLASAAGQDLPGQTATAAAGQPGSGSVANNAEVAASYSWAQWSSFSVPQMPYGAVIKNIYAVVLVSSGVCENTAVGCGAGTNLTEPWLGDEDTTSIFSFNGTGSPTEISGQFASASLGASLDGLMVMAWMGGLHAGSDWPDAVNVSFVGLAIYYSMGGGNGSSGSGVGGGTAANPIYAPWLLSVPSFSFNRSLKTNMGSFVIQNLSGDTLARDVEKILRRSAMEGAMFVWRLWQPDAQAAWLEVHGTLSVGAIEVDTAQLTGAQLLNPSQDDTPLENFCETCQIQWGGRRCGSTQSTECSYSFQTCQVIERPMITMNDYEKNYGEALANTAQQVVNRARNF